MTNFAVFANGTFWGNFCAETAEAATEAAAAEFGTEGDTEGMVAHPVTDAEASALIEWFENGSPASECPIRA